MSNNEFGDFQTPLELAQALIETLPDRPWARVLEPTCGTGTFLRAALDAFGDVDAVGIETQAGHVAQARSVSPSVRILHGSVFEVDLARDVPWRSPAGPTLVLGNPPWVTNAQLSRLGSRNRPERVNSRKVSGIDAMTGSSNFDIAESVWVKVLAEYAGRDATIALVCKTQVARNVLLHSAAAGLPIRSATLRLLDARKWFRAAVDACWFTVELGPGPAGASGQYRADVHPSIEAATPSSRLGVVNGRLVADVLAYERSAGFDGVSPVTWRQGVKHDATHAMELIDRDGPTTKGGVAVDVEDGYLFPLFKCTDVFRDRLGAVSRWLVVPQRHPGSDTATLEHDAPKLWRHLDAHAEMLDGRKSSIYRNRPRFGIFGVGAYTFTDYKIAVSGFHGTPAFRMVGPYGGKPAVFDDSTYLLPFSDAAECATVHALLTSAEVNDLIDSLVFWDSKRPLTKKLLQRIDLLAVARATDATAHGVRALTELRRFRPDATAEQVAAAVERLTQAWSVTPA